MNYIWTDYKQFYNPHEDFYSCKSESSVSFLTYINEKPNDYLSVNDIKVKILVLDEFIKYFNDYKHSTHFSSVKIEKIKKYFEQWKLIKDKK